MRLPRRVPWASIEELDQLCTWIYFDDSEESKVMAIQRLSAWRAITALPHALDSMLALLVVTHQDNSSGDRSSYLSLRQSYAAALIRLVNGLVDPLQLGVYARSIATIAAQLGLPAWLVELRHAATHEDLPSLELLRQATRESLSWLLNNYFLPTLNPSSSSEPQSNPLRPLVPLLKHYKSLVKATLRDASLRTRYKPDISATLKEIEGWIAEAKVAANVAIGGIDWDPTGTSSKVSDGDQDPREMWALDRLCDAMLEKGILVPLSKKKRNFPDDSFYPPSSSVALWSPLLMHLFQHHTDMPRLLCERIASFLMLPPSSTDHKTSSSYDLCLARWTAWIVDNCDTDLYDSESGLQLRKDIVVTLLNGTMPGANRSAKGISSLLQTLCEGDEDLMAAYSIFNQEPRIGSSFKEWTSEDLDIMLHRLNALASANDTHGGASPQINVGDGRESVMGGIKSGVVAPGWLRLDEHSGWKASPIGVYFQVP